MSYKIPVAEPDIGGEELENIIEAVKSGWISSKGNFIVEFEEKISKYFNRNFGISTSNGTTALHLALEALGIKSGDEVIVPTLTFVATANAVRYTGAKPVFVDSHPDYWCIDPEKIEEKITEKTKAIIPVHLYGHPCDMDVILEIAKEYDLYVVEDCAEAHGAEYKDKKVGSFGIINCFSFYGNKIITTGEGGMCVTNDKELAEKMKMLRDHGMSHQKKYWHEVIGFNYRMTNLQAAIGVAQLNKIDKFVEKKRKNAETYNQFLKNIQGIALPPEMPWAKNVYWMYSILATNDFGMNRERVISKLADEGIDSRPFFYPIHTMPPYKENKEYPVAQKISKEGLNLPNSVKLSDDDLKRIATCIISLFLELHREEN
jgi:perosamine synthetase